ncbi:MAG: hypothetical protein ACHQIM_22730, partial [Sphingobacteriales bacterium]
MATLTSYQIRELRQFAENAKNLETGNHRIDQVSLIVVDVFDNSDGIFRLYNAMELKPDNPNQWIIDEDGT